MTEEQLYSLILTTLIGIIGFFVKKAFSDIDKKADKTAVEKLENALREKAGKDELTTVEKDVDRLRTTTAEIKENYLTREEFMREQLKTEKKLDRIMDILMEMRGGASRE